MSSKQAQQQYEEEFDFLVVDDMEESHKSTKQPQQTNSKPIVPDNTSKSAKNIIQTVQVNDKLPTLIQQSRLKSIESEENDKQQKTTKKNNDHQSDELFKLQDSIMIDLSSEGKKQVVVGMTESKSNLNEGIKDLNEATYKSEHKQSEIFISGKRQPQRKLIRKPINLSSSLENKPEQKQKVEQKPKQQSSELIETKYQIKPQEIEDKINPSINIKFTEEITIPAKNVLSKPREYHEQDKQISQSITILTNELVQKDSSTKNSLINRTEDNNISDLTEKAAILLNPLKINQQLQQQTKNPSVPSAQYILGSNNSKNNNSPQLSEKKQMTSSITTGPIELISIGSMNRKQQNQKQKKQQLIDDVIGLLNTSKRDENSQLTQKQSNDITQSMTHSLTNQIPLTNSHNSTINQQVSKINQTKQTTHLTCSVITLTSLSKELQKSIFAINQLSHFTNTTEFNCSKLSHSFDHSNISVINYYGHSWTPINHTNSYNEQNQASVKPKFNRDMLFGSKAKINREIHQEEKQSKRQTENKTLYLYVDPKLYPLTKDSLKLNISKQGAFSFSNKLSFSQRVNLVIDLVEVLYYCHESDFMIFPHSLFPQKIQNTFLFALQQNQSSSSKSTNFLPKLKFGVHFLQSFKHLTGNSTNLFNLKEFITKVLNLQKFEQHHKTNQEPKTITDSKKTSQKIQTELKSPQLKFYHEEWFWELWNKSIKNFIEKQTPNSSKNNLLTPLWLDLFEVPLTCLKIIFGEEIITTLIESKYEQISKTVNKIKLKDKPKTVQTKKLSTKFDPTALAIKPEDQIKQKLQLVADLLSVSVLAPQAEQEILKLCQKPLLSWSQFQVSYKQFIQKHQKAPMTTNKSTPKASNPHSVLTNPDAKKIFEQLSSVISLLPFHEVSKDNYERKRLLSLKQLFDTLLKFRTIQKLGQLTVPIIKVKKSEKLSISSKKQSLPERTDKTDSNKASINLPQPEKQKGLTILSQQSNHKALAELKIQYLSLLQSSKTLSREDFQNQHVKKPQTHLLTPQLKKKLSAAFLSHSQISKSPKTYSLIYKASVFSFATKKFYQFCQNKEKLLYVFKIRNQRTLYYFNEEKIQRNKQMNGLFGGFVKDTKGTSFIYTGEELLKVKNSNKSFAVSHIHGPIIGEGDIVIKEGNIENQCNYPKSYEQGKKTSKLLKANRFILDEMDVYELTF